MCSLCDDKSTKLGILQIANRHWEMAKRYGADARKAIDDGNSRKAKDTARQAAHHALMAEHLSQEHDNRFREYFGHAPAPLGEGDRGSE